MTLVSKKHIVPQEIILNGDANQEMFICRNTDGTIAFKVMGDGTVTVLSEAQTGGTLGAVSSADATHLGFFGASEATQPAAITAAVVAAASFTHTAPAADDFAIQAPTQTSPFGFVNANEFNSVMKTIQNLLKRQEEIYAKLQTLGLIA